MLTDGARRVLSVVRASSVALALTLLLVACDRNPAEPDANVVPGEYIVRFKDHVQDVPGLANRLAEQNGGTVLRVWTLAIKGFWVRLPLPAHRAVLRLRSHPDVANVEPNYVARGLE